VIKSKHTNRGSGHIANNLQSAWANGLVCKPGQQICCNNYVESTHCDFSITKNRVHATTWSAL